MIKKVLFLGFLLSYLFAGNIMVAASANTSYAMPQIIKAFKKKYPNTNVKLVLASSGKLTAQIMHGAPYDVFLSANMKYPNFLYKKGFAKTEPKVYAKGAICLFSVKHNDLSLKNLLKYDQIAIANPKTAPYGKAAVEAFKNAGIYNKIKNKLVYAETVSAVIPYSINSTDVGVVAKSALFSPKIKRIKFFSKEIDPKLYTSINQGVVLLSNKKEAKDFYDFILSNEAKRIFEKYGYR
jgi:molybdate transport system substrate-binding protein